jgi:hypothetical protein
LSESLEKFSVAVVATDDGRFAYQVFLVCGEPRTLLTDSARYLTPAEAAQAGHKAVVSMSEPLYGGPTRLAAPAVTRDRRRRFDGQHDRVFGERYSCPYEPFLIQSRILVPPVRLAEPQCGLSWRWRHLRERPSATDRHQCRTAA